MIREDWPIVLFVIGMTVLFFGGYLLVLCEWKKVPASVPPITTTQGAAQAPNYNHPDDTETRP